MGIPHLTTFLRPYAELESFAGEHAVIDGPGLAYHIYHLCLRSRPSAQITISATPSYEEIGKKAIEWLDELQRVGLDVKMIYFDGFLPPAKLSVRIDRLRAQTNRLNDRYNANQTHFRAHATQGAKVESIVGKVTGPSLAATFPPPLLVPAVMDALNATDNYKSLTMVVPDEADLYCARFLKQHGGIVLTGDSDLLVHDLGPRGAVCFFADVGITLGTKSRTKLDSLSCHVFRPLAIADRLDLPQPHGLHAIAFEILMDSQGTFRKLLTQAISLKAINENKIKYKEFGQEYATPIVDTRQGNVSSGRGRQGPECLQALQSLDPRISELVIQFPSLADVAGQELLDSPSRHVFLPFLLDCPVRTNAWEMSTSVRQLAYGLINLIVPEDQRRPTIFEHRRQQKNSSGREWQLPDISDIPDACSDLVAVFDQLAERLSDLSFLDIWTAWAVYQDVEYSFHHGKATISDLAARQLFDIGDQSSNVQNYTWDIIQFYAQLEGSYYSFRILKQVLGLLITHNQREYFPESLFLLRDCLKPLPSLEVHRGPNVPYLGAQLLELKRVQGVARTILGIEDRESLENPPEPQKNSRKKRKRNLEEEPTSTLRYSNPFGLLDVE